VLAEIGIASQLANKLDADQDAEHDVGDDEVGPGGPRDRQGNYA
jgi:hypothetical protein